MLMVFLHEVFDQGGTIIKIENYAISIKTDVYMAFTYLHSLFNTNMVGIQQ